MTRFSRSRTRVRAKYRSTLSSKMTKIIEKPNADEERTTFTPGKPLQVDGERIGDLVLDLLRATPRPVREDDHLVVAQVRNRVDRGAQHRPEPPARDSDPKHDNEKLISQRKFDKTVNHGKPLPQRR